MAERLLAPILLATASASFIFEFTPVLMQSLTAAIISASDLISLALSYGLKLLSSTGITEESRSLYEIPLSLL